MGNEDRDLGVCAVVEPGVDPDSEDGGVYGAVGKVEIGLGGICGRAGPGGGFTNEGWK